MLKAISSDSYTIRPFVTHKQQSYTFVSGGVVSPGVTIGLALQPSTTWSYSTADPATADGLNQYSLYRSIRQLFYTSESFATQSMNWGAGGSERRLFPLSSSAYVFNVAQITYGEGILNGTFNIQSPSSTNIITDDGVGHLYVGSTVVGNIFYDMGIVVLAVTGGANPISTNGLSIPSGSSLNISFQASQTIYEYQLMATLSPSEFNFTFNPSMQSTASNGEKVSDLMLSGTLTPYITTVGFFNSDQQLVAIGKLSKPVKRLLDTPQTFIVRFDI